MKRLISATLVLLLAIVAFQVPVQAQVPELVSYQGLLTGNDGMPVPDGSYSLTFRLYETEAGGEPVWEETQTVEVVGGTFHALLGQSTALDLLFDRPYWLGTQVGSEPELEPRFRLTSSPYSLAVRSPLILRNVDQVEPGDLTPPGGDTDEPARILVWSQSDNVVRWTPPSDVTAADSDWIEDIINNEVRTSRDIVLNSGADVFRVHAADAAGRGRVESVAADGEGVDAVSTNGNGVLGTSTNGAGVRGVSTNGTGVVGVATTGQGVEGMATAGVGVEGTSADSAGVRGASQNGDGVVGEATAGGRGVVGRALGAGAGVFGSSTNGPAGRFQGDVEIRNVGNVTSKLFLEGIDPSMAVPASTVLVRDADGFVRQAPLPAGGGPDADWVDTGVSVHTTNKMIQLQDAGGAFPFTVSSGANPATRLTASTSGDAVVGTSTMAGVGVRGVSSTGVGVRGESAQANGVEGNASGGAGNGVDGFSENRYGVLGRSNAISSATTPGAGVRGEAAKAPGVSGSSTEKQGVVGVSDKENGVEGTSTEKYGVFGLTSGAGQAGVYGDGGEFSIGVEGVSMALEGVKGSSDDESGVFGTTDASISDTKQIGGVTGEGIDAYGVHGSSIQRAGVRGRTQQDHGVWGETDIADPDKAGV